MQQTIPQRTKDLSAQLAREYDEFIAAGRVPEQIPRGEYRAYPLHENRQQRETRLARSSEVMDGFNDDVAAE
jgi:hypothetical protein